MKAPPVPILAAVGSDSPHNLGMNSKVAHAVRRLIPQRLDAEYSTPRISSRPDPGEAAITRLAMFDPSEARGNPLRGIRSHAWSGISRRS